MGDGNITIYADGVILKDQPLYYDQIVDPSDNQIVKSREKNVGPEKDVSGHNQRLNIETDEGCDLVAKRTLKDGFSLEGADFRYFETKFMIGDGWNFNLSCSAEEPASCGGITSGERFEDVRVEINSVTNKYNETFHVGDKVQSVFGEVKIESIELDYHPGSWEEYQTRYEDGIPLRELQVWTSRVESGNVRKYYFTPNNLSWDREELSKRPLCCGD